MNRQSDFGYQTGGMEYRTKELCLRRAELCESRKDEPGYPYSEWAKAWRKEAETAPNAD
jgi:hypothetical protein